MHKILVADKLSDEGVALLRANPQLEVTVNTKWTPETLAAAVREADGVIVRSAVKITAEILESPGRLKAIARAGVGVDNIDVAAATRAGVLVMNTPDANTLSTAEHTVAMLLAMARHLPDACATVRSGGWDRARFQGTQLAGKTLGIIGLGRIGRAVAQRAMALEMRVIAHDPFFRGATAMDDQVTMLADVSAVFEQSDFVTLHAALTDGAEAMVNANVLAKAKPGLRLVNCARGALIDEQALADAITSGRVAGAAIDVYSSEPPPADHPLVKLPQVICTPHLGASTEEAQAAVALEAAQAMLDYLANGVVRGAINVADLPRDMSPRDRAYADLADRSGRLLSVLCPDGVDRITVTTCGDSLARLAPALRRYVAASMLGPHFDNRINIINADAVAAEHGIDVRHESRGESRGVTDNLLITVRCGEVDRVLETTVFVDGAPRMLRIDGYRMNLELGGDMVLIYNDDRPGVIGLVGTVFGNHNVNVADMALSRHEGRALMVLKLDAPPPRDCITELERHDAILSIRTARLPRIA